MNQTRGCIFKLAIGSTLLAASPGYAEFCLEPLMIGQRGQVMMGPQMPGGPSQGEWVDGFSVAAGHEDIADTPAGEGLKLMEAGEWVKAIQLIESLSGTQTLVRDESGMLRPLSRLKTQLLVSMPEEGKRTFRRLNDAAAQHKLDRAKALTQLEQRAQGYLVVIRDYPLCDAAPSAAELLGDIRFEQGRFDEAAAMYRLTAERDATKGDDPMLMARRLVSLARAGQWQLFEDISAYARFRHPQTEIQLGGQATSLPNLIDQLANLRDQSNQPADQGMHINLSVPTEDSEQFKRVLIDKQAKQDINAYAMKYGVNHAVIRMLAPVAASDNNRLFTLSLGTIRRIDPINGSDIWVDGDPAEKITALKTSVGNLRYGYHPSLILAGDRLIASVPQHNRPKHSYLRCFDANTGEVIWTWLSLDGSKPHGVVGKPIIVGQTIYAVHKHENDKKLKLVAVSLDKGEQIGSLELGSAMVNSNAGTIQLAPRLAMGQGLLMVQTNNGALIAVDPTTMSIAWAHEQQIRPPHQSELVWVARHAGDVRTHDGLVIAKDSRTNVIHAYKEHDALRLWSAVTERDATIVHVDDRHVYVLGKQLIAIELRTGKTAWWTPHAGHPAGQPVFTADTCLIAGNQRLCRVDLKTGRLTQYRETYAEPADLTLVGQTLILSYDDRLRGYPLSNNE